ncbi:transmembrane protein 237-like isoform X1 [Apostichopus japonicus]|uniref:transmembrane protein 237-like isoform X1 n=1 Tax=Stichopus japonicus TaxID=307972 RepID=UPI003AB71FE9
MQSLSNLDTPSKRRSLPPLKPLSEEDTPKKNSAPLRRTKKKKPADLLDTKTSAGDETALSEDVKGHGEDDIETEGKNTRRKKRQSYPSMDQEELEENATEEVPSLERRGKSPASRKKKRVQRSVSNEILEDSLPTNGHLTAKNRKSKNKTPRDDVDGSPLKQTQRSIAGGKGKRKKKSSRPLLSGDENYHADVETQSVDLMVSKEDIIAEETKTEPPAVNSVSILPSQPVGRLFMERKSDFTSEDKNRLAKRREQELQAQADIPQETKVTTTQTALISHQAFLTCSLFCHGLLAGYALWQCIVVFVLSSQIPNSDTSGMVQFLEQYSRLALSASSIFYLLYAVCTVSVFDRFDVGRPDRKFFRGLVTFQTGAISTLVYLICLVFSVSITAIDDRIGLYQKTELPYCGDCLESDSLWDDEDASSRLTTWKVINVIRAVGAILGWLIITVTPQTDYTSRHLHDAEEPLWEEQEMSEMTNIADMNI